MIIIPSWCAQSYAYNDRVERAVGDYLAKITGLRAEDFGTSKARPEFDFRLGDDKGWVEIELKTTSSKYIPIETHKDEQQTIETGLLTSTAPIVVTISKGTRTGYAGEVGKLRVWKRKSLLNHGVKYGIGKFYAGDTPSQGSFTYSFLPTKDIHHTWLGDIPVVYQTTTDFDTKVLAYNLGAIFDDNKIVADELLELINISRGVDE